MVKPSTFREHLTLCKVLNDACPFDIRWGNEAEYMAMATTSKPVRRSSPRRVPSSRGRSQDGALPLAFFVSAHHLQARERWPFLSL